MKHDISFANSIFFLIIGLILSANIAGGKCITLEKAKGGSEFNQNFQVEELVNSWTAMWNSYDLSMVDKLFLQDSRVSYFSSEREGLIKGFDAVREHHAGFGFVEGGKSQENRLWLEG